MEKAYDIKELRFENDYLIIVVNDETIRLRLADISEKLAKATDLERQDYRFSPSGYGIHWSKLDEDLSINGFFYKLTETIK
jgi:hypothetical protein